MRTRPCLLCASTGKKDPGRWTTEEHMLFLKGLEIYGKSWKKISEIVKTRTVVQIRTHAQKYLIKLEKAKKVGLKGVIMMDGRGVSSSGTKVGQAICTSSRATAGG
jgi:SHAQKYF class myb-like DNA-binding protein